VGLRVGIVTSQFVGNPINRQGLAEVVALNLVTLMCPQECHLRFVFDAFGNHLEIQAFCHADDCGSDRPVIGIHSDISDKRAVDFELADPKLSQVVEAGIASRKASRPHWLGVSPPLARVRDIAGRGQPHGALF